MSNPTDQRLLNWYGAMRRRPTTPQGRPRSAARIPRFESLERRDLMTAVTLTPQDQLLLELINRARADPGAEAAIYGIDLNAGLTAGSISYDAKQPLAPNRMLQIAAGGHSVDMLTNNYFSHTNLAGQSPSDRAAAAGYPTSVGENIAWGGTTGTLQPIKDVYKRHQGLFESPGHRQNLMNAAYEEIGVAVRFGPYTYSNGVTYNSSMVTEKFGSPGIDPVVTGVVYTDAADGSSDDDDFYSVGEQVTSGSIIATNINTGATFTTQIGVSGGFSVPVAAGTYNIVAVSGADGNEYVLANVVVATENVKVDFETTTATIVNIAPTLEPIADATLFIEQTEIHRNLAAADANGDTLSYSVTVASLAAHLDESLGLTTTSSVDENWGGIGEKWLAGDGGLLYYLTPSGQLFEWSGDGPASLSGDLIASLGSSFHENVQLLVAAPAGVSGVTANISGEALSIVTTPEYDGTFVVTVEVSDGVDVEATSFRVAKGNQFHHQVDQDLDLSTDGDFREDWGGRQEKWLLGAGGLEYFITPDGQFFRHDGSPQNNLTGTFVAQFDANVHERPALLYGADTHYLDVVLDLHAGNDLANPPAAPSLSERMPTYQVPEMRDAAGSRKDFTQSDVSHDRPLSDNVNLSPAALAVRAAFYDAGTEASYAGKVPAVSDHEPASQELATSVIGQGAIGQGLTDAIFAEWNS